MVYARRVGKQTLTLTVSGMLWNRSLVMQDVETRSLWSHLLGEAMQGPLKGRRLEALPAEMTTWKAWRSEHPETTVLALSRTDRRFVKTFYRRPADFVLGLVEDGHAGHVGFEKLMRTGVLNVELEEQPLLIVFDRDSTAARVFSRRVEDRDLHFRPVGANRLEDDATGSRWDSTTGAAVAGPLKGIRLRQRVGIVSFKRAWLGFHPDSVELPAISGTAGGRIGKPSGN